MRIEADLLRGVALRTIAVQWSVSKTALIRHRAHLSPASGRKVAKEVKEEPEVNLLPREEKLAALLAQGNISVAEACRRCGFNPTSSTIRSRLKPGGDIHQEVVRRMRELGLTLNVALLKVREKLDAKDRKFFQKDGLVIETRDVEAHRIQLDAAKEVLELHGAYPLRDAASAEQARQGGPIVAIQFNVAERPQESPTDGTGRVTDAIKIRTLDDEHTRP